MKKKDLKLVLLNFTTIHYVLPEKWNGGGATSSKFKLLHQEVKILLKFLISQHLNNKNSITKTSKYLF